MQDKTKPLLVVSLFCIGSFLFLIGSLLGMGRLGFSGYGGDGYQIWHNISNWWSEWINGISFIAVDWGMDFNGGIPLLHIISAVLFCKLVLYFMAWISVFSLVYRMLKNGVKSLDPITAFCLLCIVGNFLVTIMSYSQEGGSNNRYYSASQFA